MRVRPAIPPCRLTGFTLLEVLLAMIIFALVTSGVLVTFRTATRAYERSDEAMTSLQATRAISDLMARDLRSIFYVTETSYGVSLPAGEQSDSGNLETEEALALARRREREGQDWLVDYTLEQARDYLTEEDYTEDSLSVEFDFELQDGGDVDEISFVRRQSGANTWRTTDAGLMRTTYRVEGGADSSGRETGHALVREVAPVFRDMGTFIMYQGETVDEAEERYEQENPPPEPTVETLATGVEIFDAQAIHWANDEWLLSSEWRSDERVNRNPYGDIALESGDPNYSVLSNIEQQIGEDHLPTGLEIHLGLRDTVSGRLRMARFVILLAPAQESWVPPDPRLMEILEESLRREGNRR